MYLAARDFKPRGSASVKDILSHVAFGKIIKETKGGLHMQHRKDVKPSVDAKIFSRTARQTKKINVSPKVMRGGIRL